MPTNFNLDSLADTSGVLLENHTPSGAGALGTSWVKHSNFSTGSLLAIAAGTAFRNNVNNIISLYYMSAAVPNNDYTVQADFFFTGS